MGPHGRPGGFVLLIILLRPRDVAWLMGDGEIDGTSRLAGVQEPTRRRELASLAGKLTSLRPPVSGTRDSLAGEDDDD